MNEPDWKEVEEKLYRESVSAITEFSAERALNYTAPSVEKGMKWQMAKSYMAGANLLPFTNTTGDFKYQGYAQVDFEGWQEFADSDAYPKGYSEEQDYWNATCPLSSGK